jgi:hypothetical protein
MSSSTRRHSRMRDNTRRIAIENEARHYHLDSYERAQLERETSTQSTHTYTGDLVRRKAAEIVSNRKK